MHEYLCVCMQKMQIIGSVQDIAEKFDFESQFNERKKLVLLRQARLTFPHSRLEIKRENCAASLLREHMFKSSECSCKKSAGLAAPFSCTVYLNVFLF